jgi:hypothetical protein
MQALKLKITKADNSAALLLPKEALAKLRKRRDVLRKLAE